MLKHTVKKDRKIYGNWTVESPEGHSMFRCDLKKANWYLNRNLAKVVGELTIRLTFTPNGLGNNGKTFGLGQMENKCVNCGSEEYLTRHHIVPYCYRRHFPDKLKNHNFHDVMSLCTDCHEHYEINFAKKLKDQLSSEYNAPIGGYLKKLDSSKLRLSKMAKALLKHSEDMPKDRYEEISTFIKEALDISELTTEILQSITIDKKEVIELSHGQLVVSQIEDFQEFTLRWRKDFVNNMDLKYIPKDWDLNRSIWD